MVARGKRMEGWEKKVKGNIVNNITMNLHNDRLLLELVR